MRDPLFKDMGLIYAKFSKYYDGKALKVGRTRAKLGNDNEGCF